MKRKAAYKDSLSLYSQELWLAIPAINVRTVALRDTERGSRQKGHRLQWPFCLDAGWYGPIHPARSRQRASGPPTSLVDEGRKSGADCKIRFLDRPSSQPVLSCPNPSSSRTYSVDRGNQGPFTMRKLVLEKADYGSMIGSGKMVPIIWDMPVFSCLEAQVTIVFPP